MTLDRTGPPFKTAGVFGEGQVGVVGRINGSTSAPGGRVGVYGSAAGVHGENPGGIGVLGQSDFEAGVFGVSGDGPGVFGFGKTGVGGRGGKIGVLGEGELGVFGRVKGGSTSEPSEKVGVYGSGSNDERNLGGIGVHGHADSNTGVLGEADSGTGVKGVSITGAGVFGEADVGTGVKGVSTQGVGVFGEGDRVGVVGRIKGATRGVGDKVAVFGSASNGKNLDGIGVYGQADTLVGVAGVSTKGTGVFASGAVGVDAIGDPAGIFQGNVRVEGNVTVKGTLTATVTAPADVGVDEIGRGIAIVASGHVGIRVNGREFGLLCSGRRLAGYFIGPGFFDGPVIVTGHLTKSGGGFAIDHPLDPANRYLRHSFVESPDMKNVYDGVVVCDAQGAALVELPDWFEVLNSDFCYQLTPIGAAAPSLHIAAEVKDGRFKIGGGSPSLKVSWQVTGIRQDKWANAHRLVVEEDKATSERGRYLHPVEHGHASDRSIAHAHYGKALEASNEAGGRGPRDDIPPR